MIDLNHINKPYLTKELLLREVSDENIFKYYIKNLEIGKSMSSPLRKDESPSFGVFFAKSHNELFYKDFKFGMFFKEFTLYENNVNEIFNVTSKYFL